MSELSIAKKEYENSVLVADFIRKIKNIFQADDTITEFHFTPEIKGYEITYTKKGETIIISIKFRECFDGVKIKTTGSIGKKTFCSKTFEDNTTALKEIFGLIKYNRS